MTSNRLTTRAVLPVARKEGLLKGQVSWHDDAFAPMTEEQVAEFDGSLANHIERPSPI